MSFKKAMIVYRKEMMEMFRDKRTIFSTILLPFILYPVLFIGISSIMSRQTVKLEEKGAAIAIVDSVRNEASKIILKQLNDIENFKYTSYSSTSEKDYKNKYIQAVISINDSIQSSGFPVYQISVRLDKSTDQGKLIYDKVYRALKDSEREILKYRLSQQGIDTEVISTLQIRQHDTSTSQKKLGALLGAILPYLLIMLLIAGASIVASDLVAGEKERRTLETLIVSSAHRNEIVLGKYLTIITFAMINVFANLISLYFSMRNIVSQSGLEMAGVKFPINSFLIMIVAFIPMATLYAAVLLSISTFSRNMKEARSYEQPIMLISMLLAMVSIFPAIELTNGMALIPIINISLLFKAVMMGDYQLSHLLITIGSTLILDVVAIYATIKLFNKESVLFRSDADTSLKNIKKNKKAFFTPYYGLIYYALALLALYYIGSKLQAQNITKGLIQTQIFIILIPVLAIIRLTKNKPEEVLRLKGTSVKNFLLVPFIAISGAMLVTLVGQLINLIYPFPADYLEKMTEILKMPDLKLWQMYAVIAILPGICEEVMFRGFVFRFFESQGKWAAIIISALLFALFHLDPYRFIPVLLLGILLGWLMYKSDSIYISMLSHALNNALALSFANLENIDFLNKLIIRGENLNWWVGIPAAAVLVISLILFNKVNRNNQVELPDNGDR